MIARCAHCGQPQPKPRAPRRVAAVTCVDPSSCWQWDHDCYARRMRHTSKRSTFTPAGYAPATLRGREVPNATLGGAK